MRVLTSKGWQEGFLPYARGADDVALRVHRWLTIAPVQGAYFVRPKDFRLVFNYLREIGLNQVWRKIRSRNAETLRNDKYLSIGLGSSTEDGQSYVFVAPSHPRALDEIVLPRVTTRLITAATAPSPSLERALFDGPLPGALAPVVGWSQMSGTAIDPDLWASALDCAETLLADESVWAGSERIEWSGADQMHAKAAAPRSGANRRRAVLFGYGNYAKLNVIPHVGKAADLVKIHEVDPTQIPRNSTEFEWSTSPVPEGDVTYDVYYIAGYHHTHGPLAVHALRQNATAVVEKPVVVDEAQLAELVAALKSSSGRFYACFHKRYSSLNDIALADIGTPAAPIDYHAIVYEVPLPALHWYRWPNSHSRIVSNGCHWIDHCLFLNGYSKPVSIDMFTGANGTVNCSAVLENGATFSMVLTEQGSERLGVRDHVELRCRDVTVMLDDSSRYVAENSRGIIRRLRVNKMNAYGDMYRSIANAIDAGHPGDSVASIEVGSSVMLAYERLVAKR